MSSAMWWDFIKHDGEIFLMGCTIIIVHELAMIYVRKSSHKSSSVAINVISAYSLFTGTLIIVCSISVFAVTCLVLLWKALLKVLRGIFS